MRCDASRSMRAHALVRPHPSRRAHAHSSLGNFFGTRAPQDEDEHRLLQSSPYKQPLPFPRRIFAPGVLRLCFTHPESRGGRSAEKRSGAALSTRWARHNAARQALARRLASHDAGRSPLGAPPWRFFTRGRASVSGMTRSRAASSSQPGRSAWRATSRASRGERLRAAAAGRHASLRIQDRL
jgi:hypothetical protein